MAGRTPNDAPQHIAAPGVLGPHPVAQQKHAGPHVVRNDAHGHIIRLDAAIGFFGEFFHRRDDGAEQVRIIAALHTLHDRRNALQTHASVDILLWQRGERAIRGAVVLHKDQIPQLKKAVSRATQDILRACPEGRPLVNMNFRTRSTGASIAHGPEIVLLPQAHDALGRHADLLVPDLERLVVVTVHGDPELLHREL